MADIKYVLVDEDGGELVVDHRWAIHRADCPDLFHLDPLAIVGLVDNDEVAIAHAALEQLPVVMGCARTTEGA